MEELLQPADWEKALQTSEHHPVVVLKHSTTCPISAGAKTEYEKTIDENTDEAVSFYLVKVIESRSLSNQIAEDLNVKHESPQAFLIKNREPVWHTSHSHITRDALNEHIAAAE